jgi:transcriptional antiterminator RfaH
MIYWTVVHTHARSEERAAHHLRRQGYTVYLPTYMKRRKHARRVEAVSAPLFPRYLFVAIDEEAAMWRSIRSTVGVAGLLTRDERPVRVPPSVIDEIQSREDAAGFIVTRPGSPFALGEKVLILEGPFADSYGLFGGITDDQRVILLLDLLGRKVKIRVPLVTVDTAA